MITEERRLWMKGCVCKFFILIFNRDSLWLPKRGVFGMKGCVCKLLILTLIHLLCKWLVSSLFSCLVELQNLTLSILLIIKTVEMPEFIAVAGNTESTEVLSSFTWFNVTSPRQLRWLNVCSTSAVSSLRNLSTKQNCWFLPLLETGKEIRFSTHSIIFLFQVANKKFFRQWACILHT